VSIFIIITNLLGVSLLTFGWWGQYTKSGHQNFDEMAGMIPFFAFYLGVIVVVISISTLLYKKLSKLKKEKRA